MKKELPLGKGEKARRGLLFGEEANEGFAEVDGVGIAVKEAEIRLELLQRYRILGNLDDEAENEIAAELALVGKAFAEEGVLESVHNLANEL